MPDNFSFHLNQYKGGFPSVPTLAKESAVKKSKPGKKKSLFAQQFHKLDKRKDLGQEFEDQDCIGMNNNENEGEEEEEDIVIPKPKTNSSRNHDDLNESPENAGIHKENQEKLDGMSEKEILEEQERLLGTLGNFTCVYLISSAT